MPHCGTSAHRADAKFVALSRRKPRELHGARHVPVDLTDAAQCARAAAELQGATHLVYAALYEAPNLVDGWRDPNQIRTNDLMLRNLMAALEPAAPQLQARRAAAGHQGLWRPRPAAHGAGARRPLGNVRAAEFLLGAGEFSARAAAGQGLALEHSAPGPDRRRGHGRRDGSDPAARRLCRDAARAGPAAGLSRRCGAGVAGGRRRSAGARDRLGRRGGRGAQRSLQRHQWRRLHLGECLAGDCGRAGDEAGQRRAAVAGAGISEMDRALGRICAASTI